MQCENMLCTRLALQSLLCIPAPQLGSCHAVLHVSPRAQARLRSFRMPERPGAVLLVTARSSPIDPYIECQFILTCRALCWCHEHEHEPVRGVSLCLCLCLCLPCLPRSTSPPSLRSARGNLRPRRGTIPLAEWRRRRRTKPQPTRERCLLLILPSKLAHQPRQQERQSKMPELIA